MNTVLFGQIDDIVQAEPRSLNMDSWEGSPCGTSRCMAGWAVHLTTGKPLYGTDGNYHPSVRELAKQLGVEDDFEVLGAALLELDPDDAAVVFYVDNETAAEFIRLAGQGLEREALNLLPY